MDFEDDYIFEDEDIEDFDNHSEKVQNDLPSHERPNYQILTSKDLEKIMDDMSEETATVLSLPTKTCKVLLNIFRWDKDDLLQKFYDFDSLEAFFKKNKIRISYSENKTVAVKEGECQICYDHHSLKLYGLYCNHFYCEDCWSSYLINRIQEEGEPYPKCPDPSCLTLTDEASINHLLEPSDKLIHRRILVRSFVNLNHLYKCCPGVNCENIVNCETSECQTVKCLCGKIFCFGCLNDAHEPLPCNLLQHWNKRCEGDSLSLKWVSINTKDCPKCSSPIEKSGGCNRMLCRNCKFMFCWSCLIDWRVHGYNRGCNRFELENGVRLAQNRETLARYTHYYDRFMNHKNSLKIEGKLIEKIDNKMMEIQEKSSPADAYFLKNALEALRSSRRVLMYTYPFAFYLPATNSKKLFEDNQSDLEHATEELSAILEDEFEVENSNFSELKRKIQDKTHYVNRRCEVVVKHCSDGLHRGEWVFTLTL